MLENGLPEVNRKINITLELRQTFAPEYTQGIAGELGRGMFRDVPDWDRRAGGAVVDALGGSAASSVLELSVTPLGGGVHAALDS